MRKFKPGDRIILTDSEYSYKSGTKLIVTARPVWDQNSPSEDNWASIDGLIEKRICFNEKSAEFDEIWRNQQKIKKRLKVK